MRFFTLRAGLSSFVTNWRGSRDLAPVTNTRHLLKNYFAAAFVLDFASFCTAVFRRRIYSWHCDIMQLGAKSMNVTPMAAAARQNLAARNGLLAAIGRAHQERLDLHLEYLEAKAGRVLCWAGDRLDHAFFPGSAVLSVSALLADGSAIETANIGREGAFGLFEAMYTHFTFSQCLVLLPGSLIRVPFGVLRYLFEHDVHTRNLFVAYSVALRSQIEQAAACCAAHTIQARICRWLLMISGRTGSQDMCITHDSLAQTLGASRKSVSVALHAMQADGLIDYRRGRMHILDLGGLESASCECYSIIKASWTCNGGEHKAAMRTAHLTCG